MKFVRILKLTCSSLMVAALAQSAQAAGAAPAADLVPVVFAPGIVVPAQLTADFKPLYKLFEDHGYKLLVALDPAGGSIEERSEALDKEIERLVPTGNFHIVAHSMGGIDARRAIDRYGLGDRVLSLTTISTPHRGSPVADSLIKMGEQTKNPLSDIFNSPFKSIAAAGADLTTWHMAEFNEQVHDDPRVKYFSMGHYIEPKAFVTLGVSPFTLYSWNIIKKAGDENNDGMVGVESAKWGTYLGSFPGEHIAETLPLLYSYKFIYADVFNRVLNNLDAQFN